MARMAMLIDLTRCIGCDACTVACKQENGTPADVFFARVLNVEAGSYPNVKRVYIPVLCNHCENPACLKACPNKAIVKREDGIVLIDQDRCRGTGACVSACPYGNIILKKEDSWYLPEDQPYERDFVKPRLKQNVARKCTFCAQRVDRGLEPACVVACPTTARIFGDTDDPSSKISRYVDEQKDLTDREPFKLIPEAGTEPANMYLRTMAEQNQSSLGGRAEPIISENEGMREAGSEGFSGNGHRAGGIAERVPVLKTLLVVAALSLLGARSNAQVRPSPPTPLPAGARGVQVEIETSAEAKGFLGNTSLPSPSQGEGLGMRAEAREIWSNASCAGCHGPTMMGGFGPPLAELKLSESEFKETIRKGKGMMPAVPESEVSAKEVAVIYNMARTTKLDPSQIPISYKVGRLLSVKNVGMGFGIISLIALLLTLKVLWYWLDCAGIRRLWPSVVRFGPFKALGIALWSILVDGLLVASVWRKDKFRWAMHGLMLYGFLGLGMADFLMNTVNPLRSALPILHPIKLLANLSGLFVLAGIVYVRIRYKRDQFIDNGLTLGRDYLFLNLLALTILTGFFVQELRYTGAIQWVMPLYMLHLTIVATLLISAPFTRFQHAFVVPAMVAMTRVTEEIVKSGVEIGFEREPSPGRHHKSERIAAGVMNAIDPGFEGPVRLRYYP